MDTQPLNVLYEDNHCLAVYKPPGWLVHRDETGDEALADVARDYLRREYGKPGRVYLGIVHRLDRPTSGVVLFARTSKAAARLHQQFRDRQVGKVYWAVVHGHPTPAEGRMESYLAKDNAKNRVRVVDSEDAAPGDGGKVKHAALSYQVLDTGVDRALVEVRIETGRFHQIRAQFAHAGWTVVGDVKYGSACRFGRWLALHHRQLTFTHPTRREPITVQADAPEQWKQLGVELPG